MNKYTLVNRAELWRLREFHGKDLQHCHLDALGCYVAITGEHADRLMLAGHAVYARMADGSEIQEQERDTIEKELLA